MPDAKPSEVDQPHGNGAHALVPETLLVHVLGHRCAEVRKSLGETNQLVVFRLLLLRAELGVIEVLARCSAG
jgi:hypothetical protein